MDGELLDFFLDLEVLVNTIFSSPFTLIAHVLQATLPKLTLAPALPSEHHWSSMPWDTFSLYLLWTQLSHQGSGSGFQWVLDSLQATSVLAPATLPGQHLYSMPGDPLTCAQCPSSCLAKDARLMQATQGTSLQKSTPSRLGEVVILPNSQKQMQKVNIMRRQRNMFQAKEQDKIPEKDHNTMERSNLLD